MTSTTPHYDIYTDGSYNQRTGIGGCGIWFKDSNDKEMAFATTINENGTTNNRTELLAIRVAVEQIEDAKDNVRQITIYTDSQYAINCLTCWVDMWKRTSWKTLRGKREVANRDIIEPLDAKIIKLRRLRNIHIRFKYCEGHAGIEGNVAADKLASSMCVY